MSIHWFVKYQPTKNSEFVGNGKALKEVEEWLDSWGKKIPVKRGAFLYGPPGTGKTVSVYVLAKKFGYEIIEVDASDLKTNQDKERVISITGSQSTLYGVSKKIVMIDELEGISRMADRGGLNAVKEVISKSLSPVICIADDVWNPKFIELRKYCVLIKFIRIPKHTIRLYLQRICEREGLITESEALNLIAERSGGDLRSAIIDLQSFSRGKKQLRYKDLEWLSKRDREEAIFNVLGTIFSTKNCSVARKVTEVTDVDHKMLFEWIYENAPYQLTKKEDLRDAMDALSKADIYFNRIRASQNWRLLPYALEMMTSAVAVSRSKNQFKWVPFKFPQRIKRGFRTEALLKKRAIGLKIGTKYHISSNRALKEYLPYLKIIFSNDNGRYSSKIAYALDLDKEMVQELSKGTMKKKSNAS